MEELVLEAIKKAKSLIEETIKKSKESKEL